MSFSEQLIAWRRELHQNPELSGQEVDNNGAPARVADGSRDCPTALRSPDRAGCGDRQRATHWLRCAPISTRYPSTRRSGVPFSSRRAGVMHACGHDIHTSVILGAALKLKEREASLNGRVRILFQPAEENFGGAKSMVRAGALRDVRAIFGMHNEPSLPVGEFATRGGPFYANVDRFVIHVTGKGAHAARPHEGNDAIVLASQLVTALQSVASRNVNTLDSVVLSVTRIAGGNTWNVLPESVELEGTLRTHRTEVQQNVKARVGEIAAGFASAFSAQIDVTWYAGPTALVNDEHWAGVCHLGRARSGILKPGMRNCIMGGEDFAVYLQNISRARLSALAATVRIWVTSPGI